MISDRPDLDDARLASPLGRVSPVVKLAVAIVWLGGLALTSGIAPPLILAVAAAVAGLTVGRIPARAFSVALAPLGIAAFLIGVSNTVFAPANGDPTAAELLRVGPVRIAVEAVGGGVALACRVIAIAIVGAVFSLTTDPTHLVDSLVQQARVSARFAYGALAAYQAIPRFGEDLATLRQARRVRGLRGGWHPSLLIGVLVLAIRHGDRMALAMDARAFGSGPRTFYRVARWSWQDVIVAVEGVLILLVAIAVGR